MTISTSHHDNIQCESSLGYAGLLPFALAFILTLFGEEQTVTRATEVFVSYGAIILVFLSGALWQKIRTANYSQPLLMITNLLTLLGWACLALSPALALLMLAISFTCVYLIEEWADREEVPGYRRLRKRLTAIVVALHLVMLFAVG